MGSDYLMKHEIEYILKEVLHEKEIYTILFILPIFLKSQKIVVHM